MKKTIGNRIKMSALALLAAAALVLCPAVRAEAAGSFNVSDQMVGKEKLIEKTDKLTKLDLKTTADFISALKTKYAKKAVSDCTNEAEIDMKAKVPVENMGGQKMGATITAKVKVEDSRTLGLTKSESTMKASIFLFSVKVDRLSYLDKKNRTEYLKLTGSDQTGQWMRNRVDVQEDKSGIPFFDPDAVREVYMNPKTGAYAAVVDMDEASFEKMTGSGIAILKDAGVKDVDLTRSRFIMTFDKGLAAAGMYADLSDSAVDGETSVSSCKMKVTITGINTGVKISIPAEAKK